MCPRRRSTTCAHRCSSHPRWDRSAAVGSAAESAPYRDGRRLRRVPVASGQNGSTWLRAVSSSVWMLQHEGGVERVIAELVVVRHGWPVGAVAVATTETN